MAAVLCFLGIMGSIGFFLGVIVSDELVNKILCAVALIVCISVPFIGLIDNDTIISKEHVVLKQDNYEGVKYNEVVQIDYDILKYNFWTYNAVNAEKPKNVVVTFLDKK